MGCRARGVKLGSVKRETFSGRMSWEGGGEERV